MRIAAWALWVHGLLVIAAGGISLAWYGSWVTLIIGLVSGIIYMVCGTALAGGRLAAGFVAGVLALLNGLFFGYRFIATGRPVPGGVVLVASFIALFLVLVAIFREVARVERQ